MNLVAVFTYDAGRRRTVRKIHGWWVVTNHPAGPGSFGTWRLAYDYAAARYRMINTAAQGQLV